MVGRFQGADGADRKAIVSGRWRVWVAAAFAAATFAAQAAGESDRALRVELALLAGNARDMAEPATPPSRRRALAERIRSSLGSIGMVVRYALQKNPEREALLAEVHALRGAFAARDIRGLIAWANRLKAVYPLDLSYFVAAGAVPWRARLGRNIYDRYCAGCHFPSGSNPPNPAPDLFAMARTQPLDELAARMLGSVHGDRLTTLENPFSDEEIADLIVYLRGPASANHPSK